MASAFYYKPVQAPYVSCLFFLHLSLRAFPSAPCAAIFSALFLMDVKQSCCRGVSHVRSLTLGAMYFGFNTSNSNRSFQTPFSEICGALWLAIHGTGPKSWNYRLPYNWGVFGHATGPEEKHHTDVTGFDAIFSTGFFATFSRF